MQPLKTILLSPIAFGDTTSCLGGQLIVLLRVIDAFYPHLRWYVADVRTTGGSLTSYRQSTPVLTGDTKLLIEAVQNVEQFESGVFAGVPCSIEQPRFRSGGLWTEDEDCADLCDALIEVRAFDTSYWLVAISDPELGRCIDEHFQR
jgi:hypothetical protein